MVNKNVITPIKEKNFLFNFEIGSLDRELEST